MTRPLQTTRTLTPSANGSAQDTEQSIAEHLRELRTRVSWVLLTIGIASVVGYAFYGQLIALLLRPLNKPLYYVSPMGGFNFALQVSLFFGILVAIPVISYHLLRFLAPALPSTVTRLIPRYLLGSFACVLLGVSFGYLVSLPTALRFLSGFGSPDLHSLITADAYLSFVMRYLVSFVLVFQLPVVLVGVNAVHSLRVSALLRYQRHVIVGCFVVAALLSPAPDPVNMLVLTVPLILLFYLSVLLLVIMNRGRKELPLQASVSPSVSRETSIVRDVLLFLATALIAAVVGEVLLFMLFGFLQNNGSSRDFPRAIPPGLFFRK